MYQSIRALWTKGETVPLFVPGIAARPGASFASSSTNPHPLLSRRPFFLKKKEHEPTTKRVCHRSGAAFAEEDARASRSNASRFAAHIFEVLCALGVSVVRFCSEIRTCSADSRSVSPGVVFGVGMCDPAFLRRCIDSTPTLSYT